MKTKIEAKIKEAMKNGDVLTRDTLRVLMGEIQRNEQSAKNGKVELSDADIQKLVKKMSEGIKLINSNSPELWVLDEWLPKQMSEEEISLELNKILETNKIDSPKGLGLIMKHFKDNFDGQYDGRYLSEVVKTKF